MTVLLMQNSPFHLMGRWKHCQQKAPKQGIPGQEGAEPYDPKQAWLLQAGTTICLHYTHFLPRFAFIAGSLTAPLSPARQWLGLRLNPNRREAFINLELNLFLKVSTSVVLNLLGVMDLFENLIKTLDSLPRKMHINTHTHNILHTIYVIAFGESLFAPASQTTEILDLRPRSTLKNDKPQKLLGNLQVPS